MNVPRQRRYGNPNPPHQGGAPPPPPPPPSSGGGKSGGGKSGGGGKRPDNSKPGGGGGSGGGGKQGNGRRAQRRQNIGTAISNLQSAYIDQGLTPGAALQFAQVALSRPGVAIGKNGIVHYKGTTYNAKDFATSKLGQLVTGATAKAANEAAIKNDPTYRAAEAAAALQRDQLSASLMDARRRALIEFGDPSLVQGDAATAAAAGANRFSTASLLHQQDAQNRQNVGSAANQSGTLFGGGYQSGLGEANRVNAANTQDAYTRINDLLSGSGLQQAQGQQGYELTVQQALQEATQRLLASGAIHAATAPNWQIRGYKAWHAPHPGGGSANAGGHHPGPGRIPNPPSAYPGGPIVSPTVGMPPPPPPPPPPKYMY